MNAYSRTETDSASTDQRLPGGRRQGEGETGEGMEAQSRQAARMAVQRGAAPVSHGNVTRSLICDTIEPLC